MNIEKRRLQVLAKEWHGCQRCKLHEMRVGPDIFFGYGKSTPAKYLIVGGTPTESDEVFSGLFAGDEGELLFELLRTANIDLDECYFTYSVACRPKVFIPATDTEDERIEGRPPSKEEVIACRPRLYEILYQVDPRAIITLGESATKALVRGRLPKFLDCLGKQYISLLPAATPEDRVDGKATGKSRYHDLQYPVFPIPEMMSIINNPSTADHGPHAVALRTLQKAHQKVEFVIKSELATMKGSP